MALLGLLILNGCSSNKNEMSIVDSHKKMAGELKDNNLYDAAIEEYKKILARDDIDIKTKANINYLTAKIYYENLKDYKNAAAYYVRAKTLDPDGTFYLEASKNLVASLEKIGNVLTAKRELEAMTDIDALPRKKGDVAVARVGNIPIWRSELEDYIQSFPPEIQKKFITKDDKFRLLQRYVGLELMFRAAIRENYEEDPEILEQERQLRKKLMVDKYILNNVIPQIKIDTMDVRNYYEAHKKDRYNSTPYDSVKANVFIDYQGEKAEKAFADFIFKLAQNEKVEFLESNL